MRFLSAPWVGMLQDGAWLRHAEHANRMAALLDTELRKLSGAKMLFALQANSVFVELPRQVIDQLYARGWWFYTYIGEGGCRLMCSWDTTESDVLAFAGDVADLLPT